MLVSVETIDQRVDLKSSEMSTYLTIKLSDGSIIQALINEEDAQHIINASMNETSDFTIVNDPQEYQIPTQTIDTPEMSRFVEQITPEPVTVQNEEVPQVWENFPEEVLPSNLKKLLKDHAVPSLLTESQLVKSLEDITQKLMQEGLKKKVGVVSDKDKKRATERIKKIASQLDEELPASIRRVGNILIQIPTPMNTVPKDNLGYPIVSRQAPTLDPGEVALGVDEDGVGQL